MFDYSPIGGARPSCMVARKCQSSSNSSDWRELWRD